MSRIRIGATTGQLDQVSGLSGGWALARVTFKAYSWQLFFKPWTSAIGLFPPLFAAAIVVVWWQAFSLLPLLQFGLRIVVVYVFAAVFIAVMTAAAVGSAPLIHRASRRRTAYLLKQGRGRACVLIDETGPGQWELSALAAWPRRSGLGSALGQALIRQADTAGADLALWCTRSLEPLYNRWGFETVGRRFGMRRMRRSTIGADSPLACTRPDQ